MASFEKGLFVTSKVGKQGSPASGASNVQMLAMPVLLKSLNVLQGFMSRVFLAKLIDITLSGPPDLRRHGLGDDIGSQIGCAP
jgi:hypothetical protein